MKPFQIMNSILMEEREEALMQTNVAQEKKSGFMLFRPHIMEKYANGDKLVDAVLGIADVYEDGTCYGYAKPGLFLVDKNNMVFAKLKEDNASVVKLYEKPFPLKEASFSLQFSPLIQQAVYDKNHGITQITDGDIQKVGDTFVTNEQQMMVIQKTRNAEGVVIETKIFEQHPSGRKELLVKLDRDILAAVATKPELQK